LAIQFQHANIVQTITFETKIFKYEEIEQILQVLPPTMDNYKDPFLGRAKRLGEMETTCIQMELCGENLKAWLDQVNDKNDPTIQKMQIIIPDNIIVGLRFLHDHKIIHRDLKPLNILFSSVNFCLPVKIGKFLNSN
jgi:serine/threonine protein kinase